MNIQDLPNTIFTGTSGSSGAIAAIAIATITITAADHIAQKFGKDLTSATHPKNKEEKTKSKEKD